MAKKKAPTQRKKRTREHVIADLSINFVEKQALLCSFSVQEVMRDYGLDLLIFTYNSDGEAEEGHILVQVKATDDLNLTTDEQKVLFRIERADLIRWLAEPMPVILVVYDAKNDRAWWLYIQQYFKAQPEFNLFRAGKTIAIEIPIARRLDADAMQQFRQFRTNVITQLPETLHT